MEVMFTFETILFNLFMWKSFSVIGDESLAGVAASEGTDEERPSGMKWEQLFGIV